MDFQSLFSILQNLGQAQGCILCPLPTYNIKKQTTRFGVKQVLAAPPPPPPRWYIFNAILSKKSLNVSTGACSKRSVHRSATPIRFLQICTHHMCAQICAIHLHKLFWQQYLHLLDQLDRSVVIAGEKMDFAEMLDFCVFLTSFSVYNSLLWETNIAFFRCNVIIRKRWITKCRIVACLIIYFCAGQRSEFIWLIIFW